MGRREREGPLHGRRAAGAARAARGRGDLRRWEKPAAAALADERFGGQTEDQWRASAEKYRNAIAQLEERADACEDDSFRWSPGAGSRAYREEQSEADACRRVGDDLDMNRRWLEKLEENAHRAGAPPGWLRE